MHTTFGVGNFTNGSTRDALRPPRSPTSASRSSGRINQEPRVIGSRSCRSRSCLANCPMAEHKLRSQNLSVRLDDVNLPRLVAWPMHPHLVLDRVAARHVNLGLGVHALLG
jgi:hypothetical protein